jgi:hypothetical protein
MAKTAVDIELFKDWQMWFINNSLCKEFRDSPIPNEVSALLPTIIQDRKRNDTAEDMDPSLETTFSDTQYFFQVLKIQVKNLLCTRRQERLVHW